MIFRIVADSSINMMEMPQVDFKTVPMKILCGMKEYIDNETLNVETMCVDLETTKGKTGTSCPNVQEWKDAFEGADEVLAITISNQLSGSYSSCQIAMGEFLDEHPRAKGHVFDSLSTGPMMRMVATQAVQLRSEQPDFEGMVSELNLYRKHACLIFTLASMKNLARNGRVSPAIAKAAGILGIRLVAMGDENGSIKQVTRCRGEKKLPQILLDTMEDRSYEGGWVHMDHCLNPDLANRIRDRILEKYPSARVTIGEVTGLCAYYAERGGIIIGFEKREAGL